jgi:hypothetical protein
LTRRNCFPASIIASIIPAAHQRSAICPSHQRLTFAGVFAQTENSIQSVEHNVRGSVGATFRRSTVKVSSSPSRRLAETSGSGPVEFGAQGQQRCFGLQRRAGMVGVGHRNKFANVSRTVPNRRDGVSSSCYGK